MGRQGPLRPPNILLKKGEKKKRKGKEKERQKEKRKGKKKNKKGKNKKRQPINQFVISCLIIQHEGSPKAVFFSVRFVFVVVSVSTRRLYQSIEILEK